MSPVSLIAFRPLEFPGFVYSKSKAAATHTFGPLSGLLVLISQRLAIEKTIVHHAKSVSPPAKCMADVCGAAASFCFPKKIYWGLLGCPLTHWLDGLIDQLYIINLLCFGVVTSTTTRFLAVVVACFIGVSSDKVIYDIWCACDYEARSSSNFCLKYERTSRNERSHYSAFFLNVSHSYCLITTPCLGMALKASNVVGNPVTLHQIW
jgi:hypothetical protein